MIRQATFEDIPAIQAMAEVVFRETYREILSPEQMEYMMDMMYSTQSLENQLAEGVFFVCADVGSAQRQAAPERLVGYASVRPDGFAADGRPRYHLEKLYILPSHQKSGLGRQLFETVCSYVLAEISAAGHAIRNAVDTTPSSSSVGRITSQPVATDQDSRSVALLELNVNRGNPALGFYERLGLRRARSGDFPIGRGFYMNDYILALDL